jgi:hypothetical protein
MGFSKKRDILYALKPDVAVIPECSGDAVNLCSGDGYSGCWWGDKKNKGLAVIAAKPWILEVGKPHPMGTLSVFLSLSLPKSSFNTATCCESVFCESV